MSGIAAGEFEPGPRRHVGVEGIGAGHRAGVLTGWRWRSRAARACDDRSNWRGRQPRARTRPRREWVGSRSGRERVGSRRRGELVGGTAGSRGIRGRHKRRPKACNRAAHRRRRRDRSRVAGRAIGSGPGRGGRHGRGWASPRRGPCLRGSPCGASGRPNDRDSAHDLELTHQSLRLSLLQGLTRPQVLGGYGLGHSGQRDTMLRRERRSEARLSDSAGIGRTHHEHVKELTGHASSISGLVGLPSCANACSRRKKVDGASGISRMAIWQW